MLLGVLSGCSSSSADSKPECDDFGIQVVAEKWVRQKLKNPAGAEFSPYSETTFRHAGDTVFVTGWVDATNSFGAVIRNSYIVQATCKEGTMTYIASEVLPR